MPTTGTRTSPISAVRLASLAAECLQIPADEIDVRVPLTRYGLDSLATAELVAALARELGRDLPDSLLIDYPSIESLAGVLALDGGPGALAMARTERVVCGAARDQMRVDSALPPEIRPEGCALPSGAERSILLTGATGFVGAHLLAALLRETSARLYCLARPKGHVDGRSRVIRALHAYESWDPLWASRLEAIEGDVGRPLLGLSPERFDALSRGIDVVYHGAALVDWIHPYPALRGVNVLGTVELLRLACRHRPKRFHFVSTLAVCYSTLGPREVCERDDVLPYLDGIHLGYARSKCVAETLVRQAGERGLPVTIYRPSLVSGSVGTGISNTDDILAALIKGCIQMGCAPDLDWVLDCCPVDHVADAIVRLARFGDEPVRVFHLANPRPRHWRECVLWLNLYGYRVRLVPYAYWLRRLAADASAPGHALHRLRSFFEARPAGQGGLTLPELYEEGVKSRAHSEHTWKALASLALPCPPLTAELLDRYFSVFVASRFLPAVDRPRRPSDDPGAQRVDAEFFGGILRRFYGDDTIKVSHVARISRASEHSILTELTSWRYGRASGLSRYRLMVESRRPAAPGALDVMVKVKPRDEEVIAVGERVARLCGEEIGRAYARFRDRLGLAGCHVREIGVYEQSDPRFRRHTPVLFGSRRDDDRNAWILILEYLADVVLMDSADDVSGWRREHVEATVHGLAQLQAIWYGRETDLMRQPWLGPVLSAGDMEQMSGLWEALAEHAAPLFSDWVGSDIRARQAGLVADVGHRHRVLETMPRTLIHNDFNPRNLALRRTDTGFRLCAYDWELATLGVPQHDLAELLCFVLIPGVSADEVAHYLDLHRVDLEHATGRSIAPAAWRLGFRLALEDLLLNRFAMYTLVHRFRRQRFLERVLRTWWTLWSLFRDPSTARVTP